ncbi:LOW QUALITY PROTEIN: dual oxidase maturation factor 1-like [Limulus polyphemus]|uniref:LOW QUALITY PROTEIN: dual oxidase maturation factor 1-like n=1 Tax=Limulus polyphemus TaxID=6850 RepID=A0ABM1ST69_LIMPO|nr:LOW QUALITY PROTEIN: dual oxidase maturation factor 1-like [Limulus polyphemus]
MVKGWFDAFRSDGGPTLYTYSNRTPVIEDIRNIVIYVSFSTVFLAFLIVFPGIRKERLSTFVCVTISLFVGAVILVCNFGSDWHVAETTIYTSHHAFSTQKIETDLGVHIGLNGVNITLRAMPINSILEDINYNERFSWIGATELKEEYREALIKGLPFPILTIAEYLSQDLEGFCWGRRYRQAGYYSNILLWTAFSLWLLMNILLCTVPRYGAYCMQLTGGVMLFTNAVYALLLPRKPLVIPFEGGLLKFHYGWCFWLLLVAGIVAVLIGVTVAVVDIIYPNKFSTILEVDYDTPYRYFVGQDNTVFTKVENASFELQPTAKSVDAAVPGTSKEGVDNAAYLNDDSDVSTIINGKRAVSLHSFGKFAHREALRKGPVSPINRKISGHRSGDVNIDIQAAAMW